MTQPSKRHGKEKITKALKKETWLLFSLILTVTVINFLINKQDVVWAKSFAIGFLLSYVSHLVFAWLVFKHTGYQARRNIVNNMYIGAMFKWFISIFGFTLIFIIIKPIAAFGVLLGFIVMQIGHALISLNIR